MVALNWKVYYSIIIQIFQEIAIYSKQSLAAAIFHSVGTGYIQPPQQVASDILNCSSNILLGKALIANTGWKHCHAFSMMCSHSTIQRYYRHGLQSNKHWKSFIHSPSIHHSCHYCSRMYQVSQKTSWAYIKKKKRKVQPCYISYIHQDKNLLCYAQSNSNISSWSTQQEGNLQEEHSTRWGCSIWTCSNRGSMWM